MITPDERQEILQAAVDKWGEEPQIGLMQEECAELIQAISKYRRYGDKVLAKVHEEIADVQIMLDQMKLIFLRESIERHENDKLVRLAERVGVRRRPDMEKPTTKYTAAQAIETLEALRGNCYGQDEKGFPYPHGGCLFNCSIDMAVEALRAQKPDGWFNSPNAYPPPKNCAECLADGITRACRCGDYECEHLEGRVRK